MWSEKKKTCSNACFLFDRQIIFNPPFWARECWVVEKETDPRLPTGFNNTFKCMLEHTFRFGNIVFPKGEKVAEKVLHKFSCWFCWDPDGALWKSVLIKANFMVFDRSDMNRSLYVGYLFHPRRDGSQVNWRNLSSIVKIMKNNLWPKSSVTDFYIFLICPTISQKQRCSVYYYIKKLKDWSFVPKKKSCRNYFLWVNLLVYCLIFFSLNTNISAM